MFIDTNQRRINPYAPYTDANGTRYANLTDPAIRAQLGVTEIADPTPPQDYTEDTYYRTEQDEAPYVVYTKKSDEQIKEAHNGKVWGQIDALEKQQLLPRVLREFLLEQPGAAQKPWFAKVKGLDDEVVALKAGLLP